MNQPTISVLSPPAPSSASGGISVLSRFEAGGAAFEPVPALMKGIVDGNSIAGLVKVIAFWLARGIILPAELVFRTQIGERYINPLVVAASVCAIALVQMAGRGVLLWPYVVIGGGLAWHFTIRTIAQRKGEHWHSYSEGESRLYFESLAKKQRATYGPFSTIDVAKNFTEPLVVLAIYLVLLLPTGLFGLLFQSPARLVMSTPGLSFLAVMAVTMAAYQYYCSRVRRGQLLDTLDAKVLLDAEQKSKDAPPEQSLKRHRGVAYLPVGQVFPWKRNAVAATDTTLPPATVKKSAAAPTKVPIATAAPEARYILRPTTLAEKKAVVRKRRQGLFRYVVAGIGHRVSGTFQLGGVSLRRGILFAITGKYYF